MSPGESPDLALEDGEVFAAGEARVAKGLRGGARASLQGIVEVKSETKIAAPKRNAVRGCKDEVVIGLCPTVPLENISVALE